MDNNIDIDWGDLGFSYIKTDFRYRSKWKDGNWDEGSLNEDNILKISEASTALHYGQQCFEGLKAYRTKEGKIHLFRPDMNAKRMQDSCRRLLMPEVPINKFIEACKMVVKANEYYLPPYGTGGALYLRPFIIGVGDNIGVKPAMEYIFSVFCVPVGAYYKRGITPVNMGVSEYDRAAPNGTGAVKVGGNYAASIYSHEKAIENGLADCIYLDAATHTKIEEAGTANFIAITYDNKLITPASPSILPSVTKYSLLYIAKHYLGLRVEERDIFIDELDEIIEAGACGTAAVIVPIGGIVYKGKYHTFFSEKEAGPVIKKLYDILVGIQFGEMDPPKGWIIEVT